MLSNNFFIWCLVNKILFWYFRQLVFNIKLCCVLKRNNNFSFCLVLYPYFVKSLNNFTNIVPLKLFHLYFYFLAYKKHLQISIYIFTIFNYLTNIFWFINRHILTFSHLCLKHTLEFSPNSNQLTTNTHTHTHTHSLPWSSSPNLKSLKATTGFAMFNLNQTTQTSKHCFQFHFNNHDSMFILFVFSFHNVCLYLNLHHPNLFCFLPLFLFDFYLLLWLWWWLCTKKMTW